MPMTKQLQDSQDRPRQTGEQQKDLTGRDRLVTNVIFSWAAHSVFIVAGFVMPRMIDRRLGQELLGVWDFSWSLVNYFQLVRAEIGSSVNRYVARYWATGDIAGVNLVASTASLLLCIAGLLVIGLTVAVSLLLPQCFGDRLGENIREAQWVVLFLGLSLGAQTFFSVFNGILTGCHCWGLHNLNKSGWYAATVIGMIVALVLGGRLWALAAIILAGEILSGMRRAVLARRVCAGLRLRPSLVRRSMMRDLLVFGGKTLIPSISNLLLNQTTSILIVAYLGPAALALYTRPRSLMHHVHTLVSKMAMTLTPTTSSLQNAGNLAEIRELVVKSTRYSFHIALPVVLMLTVFGGSIMQFWMGPRYADGLVPAILATGYLAVLAQLPALNILAGLNAHGRVGVARFVASLCSVGLGVLVLGHLKWGLVGIAVAVTLPLMILNAVGIPILMCRRFGLDGKQYLLSVAVGPALYTLPFAVCLIGARLVFTTRPLIGFLCGATTGAVVLGVLYWRYVLPKSMLMTITGIFRRADIRYRLRQVILMVMEWIGLIRIFQFFRRHQITIVTIHGVMDERDNPAWKPLRSRLSRNRLEEYLKVLSTRYRFVPLRDAVEMLQGRKPVKPYSLVLTFDDGYRNNLTHALPILRRYNAPATFFVPTGFMGDPRPFWFDRLDYALQQTQVDGREVRIGSFTMRLDGSSREALRESYRRLRRTAKELQMSDHEFLLEMEQLAAQLEEESGRALADIQAEDDWSAIVSWEQIEKIGNGDVNFGSHTVDHIRLGLVDQDVASNQLNESKRAIEEHTRQECLGVCYPNGSFTQETASLSRKCGYRCGVTTKEGLNRVGDDVMTLRRIHVPINAICRDLLFRLSVTCS